MDISYFLKFYNHQDKIIFWSNASSVFMAIAILLLWAANLGKLPKQLPLFYSLPWGDSQLGTYQQFLVLPSLLFSVVLVNLIISTQLHDSQLVIKRILSLSSLLVSFLFFVTAFKIIYIFI